MPALDWTLAAAEVPQSGRDVSRTATEAERTRLASDLEITAVESVVLTGRVRPHGRDGYRLEGKLAAKVSQACVVSLDPVPESLDIVLSVDFAPEEQASAPIPEGDHDEAAAEAPIVEAIRHGVLDIGEVVYQEIAAALDPYPRASGAALETSEAGPGGDDDTHPFAKLRNLAKPKADGE